MTYCQCTIFHEMSRTHSLGLSEPDVVVRSALQKVLVANVVFDGYERHIPAICEHIADR